MFRRFKRNVVKMFREILVYHNNSLEFRAKILTLVIASDRDMSSCEKKLLKEISYEIYSDDDGRADLLEDTVYEYIQKIETNNGLNFEHLIVQVERDVKESRRFCKKIDIDMLNQFSECLSSEDDKIFNRRILDFLKDIKDEYGSL